MLSHSDGHNPNVHLIGPHGPTQHHFDIDIGQALLCDHISVKLKAQIKLFVRLVLMAKASLVSS